MSASQTINAPIDSNAQQGMTWWNSMTEADRRYWCFAATTATPAEAWRYFQSVTAPKSEEDATWLAHSPMGLEES